MTPQQLSWLDAPPDPTYRSDGTETSRVAGKRVKRNVREDEVLEAMRKLVCAVDSHDISDALAAYGLHRPSNTVARRLTSLERAGKVRRAGTKQGRYGSPTTLWRLVA